jgi:hypothetical protein
MATQWRGAKSARVDVCKVLDFFGGADALSAALRKHKVIKITPYAILQWRTRKHIPFARRFDLEMLAERQNRPFEFKNFLLKKEAPCPSEPATNS